MEFFKEKTQKQAMREAGLQEMPKKLLPSDNRFWIKAIALVTRYNGQQSYVLAERNASMLIRYVRDFVSCSPIKGLVALFPYVYLDEDRCPRTAMSADELGRIYPNRLIDPTDAEVLSLLTLQVAIDRQLAEPDPYSVSPDETEIEEAPNVSTEDGTMEVEQSSITEDITIESIEMVKPTTTEKPKRGRKAKK